MPNTLRVQYATWTHFEWWVPIDADTHVYIQLATQPGRGLRALRYRLFYWLWVRWVFHGMFNEEDALMVDVMDAPPERLYRPDIAITEWRKLCEADPRAAPQPVPAEATVGPDGRVEPAQEAADPTARRVPRLRTRRPTDGGPPPVRDDTALRRRSRLPITHRLRILIRR
jgi:hypothetical protein